jgi:hypothetical protein
LAKLSKGELRLKELEKEIKRRGVSLGYERLQYAGLMLKSGLCWFKGRYYLFVDRRKKLRDRIELLEGALEELNRLAAEGRLDRPFAGEAGPAATPEAAPAAAPAAEPAAEPGAAARAAPSGPAAAGEEAK